MPLLFNTHNVIYRKIVIMALQNKEDLNNVKLLNLYTRFIQKLFGRNKAKVFQREEQETDEEKVCYLLHFDINHPTNQIIVFDCSAILKHQLQKQGTRNSFIRELSQFGKEEMH